MWAMVASLALLLAGLYWMLRQWFSHGPSLFSAAVAVLLPTTGELFGWGGGATLLGTAFLAFTLAAVERWINKGGRGGFLVGALLGATAMTHPFPFAVAVLCLVTRWVLLVAERRRFSVGWDALGARGLASVAVLAIPAILFARQYYFGPSPALRAPHVIEAWDLLRWGFGGSWAAWGLAILALIGIVTCVQRAIVGYAACLSAIVIVLPAILDADVTYLNRIVYLLPFILAMGVAAMVAWARTLRVRSTPRPLHVRSLAAALLTFVALSAYVPRLERAVQYYQWIDSVDVPAFEALRGGSGAVMTSWREADYGDGVATSWFVEGLSKRPAYGPGAPWLASVPSQYEAGLDMQRIFAGSAGIDNGALQVAGAPMGATADLTLSVQSEGFYYPLMLERTDAETFPTLPASGASGVTGSDSLSWTFLDASGTTVLSKRAWLDRNEAIVRYQMSGATDHSDWSLWFWPANGMDWTNVDTRAGSVEGSLSLNGEMLRFRMRVAGAIVTYHPYTPRLQRQAIQIHARDHSSLEITIHVDPALVSGAPRSFDEGTLIAKYDISNAIVLKNSELMGRFDTDPCYVQVNATRNLVVYKVNAESCMPEPGDGT
jgi:hypothetical protein